MAKSVPNFHGQKVYNLTSGATLPAWISDRKKTSVWPEGRRDVRVGRTTRRLRALSKDLEEVLRTRRRRRRCCQRQLCSRWRSMEGRGRRVVELGEQLVGNETQLAWMRAILDALEPGRAETDTATSCRDSSLRVAVTMTSSSACTKGSRAVL